MVLLVLTGICKQLLLETPVRLKNWVQLQEWKKADIQIEVSPLSHGSHMTSLTQVISHFRCLRVWGGGAVGVLMFHSHVPNCHLMSNMPPRAHHLIWPQFDKGSGGM